MHNFKRPSTGEAFLARLADVLPWLAIGYLFGISFIAQPAKFITPTLTTPQLVSVGASIFSASHVVQWILLSLLLITAAPRKELPKRAAFYVAVAASMLVVQQVWLVPALGDRLSRLLAGSQVGTSPHHAAYVALEVLKLAGLTLLARLRTSLAASSSPRVKVASI